MPCYALASRMSNAQPQPPGGADAGGRRGGHKAAPRRQDRPPLSARRSRLRGVKTSTRGEWRVALSELERWQREGPLPPREP